MDTRQYKGKSAPFDNTLEALTYIGAVYGAQALLSDHVEALLKEVAPHLPPLGRNLVHTVIYVGALVILKEALDTSERAQEKAYDQAVNSVVENIGTNRNLVESILSEFVYALGWEISASTPVTEIERLPRKPDMKARSVYADLKIGQRYVEFGKYKWRVLDVKDGKALLLSEEILEKREYHHEDVSTWENCDLRGYLNVDFLWTFNDEEQKQIATVINKNEDNQWFSTEGGNDTKDNIFLLSLTECVKYFGDSGRFHNPTKGDKDQGDFHDQYNDVRKAKYSNDWHGWWLRSPGKDSSYAAYVSISGKLNMYLYHIDYTEGGVRPALWLKL
jgi:hypothetical protein